VGKNKTKVTGTLVNVFLLLAGLILTIVSIYPQINGYNYGFLAFSIIGIPALFIGTAGLFSKKSPKDLNPGLMVAVFTFIFVTLVGYVALGLMTYYFGKNFLIV
jgi:hypothetical membrane protein